VDDNLVLVEADIVGDRLAVVLGGARELEGLGAVERRVKSDLAGLVGVATLERGLGGGVGLLGALGLTTCITTSCISNRSC